VLVYSKQEQTLEKEVWNKALLSKSDYSKIPIVVLHERVKVEALSIL
jgi:hypothetical protein